MAGPYPHLNHAPITEALLDIRVELPVGTPIGALSPFGDFVKAGFPECRPLINLQATFGGLGETPSASAERETVGHIYWNEAKTRAVQARLNGFTMNHVKLYEEWSRLRDDARAYWAEYVRIAAPSRAVRCALRFINRIEVSALVDLKQVLRTRLEVSDGISPLMDEYFARVVVPFEDGRKAAITQASEPLTKAAATERAVILDIDVFSTKVFKPTDDAIWSEFESLRDIKNKCFFESLTPEKVETYR